MERRSWMLSAVTLLVLTAFLLLGLFLLALASSPLWKDQVFLVLQEEQTLLIMGTCLVSVSVLFLAIAHWVTRHRFLHLHMGTTRTVDASKSLVESYLAQFWKEHYPASTVQSQVYCGKKGRLTIKADLPLEEEVELKKLEQRLQSFLGKHLDYHRSFDFYLRLQNK